MKQLFLPYLILLLLSGCADVEERNSGGKLYPCKQMHKAHFAGDSWKSYRIKNRFGNRRYTPQRHYLYNKVGMASWYGSDFHNKKTASGMIFNKNKLTAAHRTLPLPCLAEVVNLQNGRKVTVLVNDRGPFVGEDRIIDLSEGAAKKLGFYKEGLAKVRVKVLEQHTREMLKEHTTSSSGSRKKRTSPRKRM